jgi:hypothetical protein
MPALRSTPEKHSWVNTLEGLIVAAAVFGLFVWAFTTRLRFLLETPFPVGVDGYYYAIQVRSLLESGHLFYPAPPLVFLWLAPFAALTDPIVGTKIGAAAGTAAIVFPAYLLAQRLSGDRWASMVGAAIAATSAQSFYLATEFIKQGVGLTLTMSFLAALVPALAHSNRPRITFAVVLLGLTSLAHKMALVIALLVAIPAVALEVRRRNFRLRAGGLVLAGLSFIVLAGGLALAHEHVLGREGVLLLAHTFRVDADWSFAALVRGDGMRLFFRHEVRWATLAALLVVTSEFLRWKPTRPETARDGIPPVALGLVVLSFALALPWWNIEDRQGLAMRFRLTAFLSLAPCSALILARLFDFIPGRARALATVGATTALLFLLPSRLQEGVVFVRPERVQAVRALKGILPPDALVITTDRQLAFMTTWYTRAAARKTVLPGSKLERTYRLITRRVLESGLAGELDACRIRSLPSESRPLDLLPHMPNEMVLLTELGFQRLVANLPAESQRYWREWPGK